MAASIGLFFFLLWQSVGVIDLDVVKKIILGDIFPYQLFLMLFLFYNLLILLQQILISYPFQWLLIRLFPDIFLNLMLILIG
jgi:hypothetical protein